MYKVGHSGTSVPRSTLVYNGRRNVPTRSEICGKTLNHYSVGGDACQKQMNMQIPALSKKNHNRASPDIIKPVNVEACSILRKATEEFLNDSSGQPDKTIKHYVPKKDLPKDFVPFDIERHVTERFLKDVNLDPKIVNGFCKITR